MNHFETLLAVRKELRLSERIMVTHLNSATIAESQNGMLFSTLKLSGHPFDTETDERLNQLKLTWHRALMALDERCAIHVTMHRKLVDARLKGGFKQKYTKEIDDRYQQQFSGQQHFANELYITVIYKGLLTGKVAIGIRWLSILSDQAVKGQRQLKRQEQMERLTAAILQLKTSLVDFSPRMLGENDSSEGFSELMAYISLFTNGGDTLRCQWAPTVVTAASSDAAKAARVIYPRGHLGHFLCQRRVMFGRCIQWVAATENDNKYSAMISLKCYAQHSASIMLDPLLSVQCEFIMVNSFAVEAKDTAQERIRKQIVKMQALNDPGVSQVEQLHVARDELQSDQLKMGYHHNSLMIIADSEDALEKQVARIIKIYLDAGMIAIRETLGQEPAFWAQIPTHSKYIARSSMVSSLNFVDFSPLHNYRRGDIDCNHLGSAMALAETPSRTPITVHCHAQGSPDNPSPGHTVMIGGNGSGKTVAMCFCDSQLSRYGGRSVFFDRNRGCDIYVRACDGIYSVLSPAHDKAISFNPFQLPNTFENRGFVKMWMKQLVLREGESEIDDDSAAEIEDCVDYAFAQLSISIRCLTTVCQRLSLNFPRYTRLRRWLRGADGAPDGEYAYIFDNEKDSFRIADKMGFDMTHFLDNEPESVLTAVSMYIFHCIEQSLDGRLVSIFMDEGWQYLDNPYWKNKLQRWLPTLRKLNAHIVLATQSPQTVVNSDISHVILDNSATQMYFANPQAQAEVYVNGFNLTQAEYQCIKNMNPSSHYFLYKQAHSSCLCRFPLAAMTEDLVVLSATAESVSRCERLRKHYGEESDQWLSMFRQGVS